MLVLARKKEEGVTILHPLIPGVEVRVKIVEIRGDVVKLGVSADRSVIVHRDEVVERIRTAARAGKISKLREQLDHEEHNAY